MILVLFLGWFVCVWSRYWRRLVMIDVVCLLVLCSFIELGVC